MHSLPKIPSPETRTLYIYPWNPNAQRWGGLQMNDNGVILHPLSGCTNAHANACSMGVDNSQSTIQPPDDFGRYAMSTIETALLPYFIGVFADATQCGKLTMILEGSNNRPASKRHGQSMRRRHGLP